jgi:ABC-type transport system involved in multi-copper enzyme maturation permease subunit
VTVVFTIAANVFRESVRDKVLYNLVAFAVLLMGASYLIGQLTAGQDIKIIKDLGLAATSVFGLVIAVFIGIGLVWKEVERKSIYSLLAKPVRRREFIVGKYLGLVLTLAVNLAAMTASLYLVLAFMAWTMPLNEQMVWEAPAVDPRLLAAVVLIFAELAIVTAIALFFSSFSTPLLSAALTLGLFIVGRFNADLKNFEQVVESRVVVVFARALYYTLPNLAPFDVKAAVVHGQAVPAGYLALTLAYAVVYIAIVVTVTSIIFSRRDFK